LSFSTGRRSSTENEMISLPVALLLAFLQVSGVPESSLDFSGISAFWKIVETLQEDAEPTPEQWNILFATPGYQVLTQSEFRVSFFKRNFALAFMPSKKAELETALKSKRQRPFLQHYMKALERRSELDAKMVELEKSTVIAAALRRAREYLPDEIVSHKPPVSFVIFANDARGYDPIVMDLLATLDQDITPFLGHEFHHWYRNHLLAYFVRAIERSDQALVAVLNQLQAEGIADQIDKKAWFGPAGAIPPSRVSYARRFQEALDKTPKVIQSLDAYLTLYKDVEPETRRKIGKKMSRLIPMSGHPTGFYMANAILEKLGKDHLVEHVGNPFAFFRLYQQAAETDQGRHPTFSEESMELIETLERRYCVRD
jgi:hypothetical protein